MSYSEETLNWEDVSVDYWNEYELEIEEDVDMRMYMFVSSETRLDVLACMVL